MAFDSLASKLQMAVRRVTGKGRLSEKDIEGMLREIRLSLLEADVNLNVVKHFSEKIKEEALGAHILKGLNPSQQVIKVVKDNLTEMLGGSETPFVTDTKTTRVILSGLQGSGKTTSVAKLARYLTKHHAKTPLLVAPDVYRPAAIDQLKTLGEDLNVPVYEEGTDVDPVTIAKNALKYADENGHDALIFDTAGRLHIDDSMIDEIKAIHQIVNPTHALLVLDAMTGQDAVNVAKHFADHLKLTGAILTKFDGDTRGGAALSLRHVADVPIVFMGVGEKTSDLEKFYPERIAERILGMGDVLTLVDKVSENVSEADMMNMMEKMTSGHYNFDDFYKQLKMIKRMGSIGGLMKLIPGMNKMLNSANVDESRLASIEALIQSMTKKERKDPGLIKKSANRRRRVAHGSGRSVADLNRLITSFDQQMQMVKRMGSMDPSAMAQNPGAMMPKQKVKKGKGKNRGGFRF
jgi:signal recognition particle subunit SRP54